MSWGIRTTIQDARLMEPEMPLRVVHMSSAAAAIIVVDILVVIQFGMGMIFLHRGRHIGGFRSRLPMSDMLPGNQIRYAGRSRSE